MKKMTREERNQRMLNEPISKVIPSLAIPTIISMLITAIYNMADTFFVSQLGTSASGAVGIIFSAMAIIQALAFTIGMGCGVNVSAALGAGDEDKAKTFVCTAVFTAFLTGIVVGAAGLLSIDPLVRFLGATETIAPYARDYATYIFYATPFMMASLVMNNQLRFQGMAFYGMLGITSGGILNMVLDPLFIFGLGMGISGAALATAISQFTSFCILLVMCDTRSGCIHIELKHFHPSLKLYARMVYNGFPSLGRQGIAAIATIILNTTAGAYGDAAIAAISIVNRYTMFINSSVIGFGQGFQPVCGFCYGAGRYARVREAYRFCIKVATVILLVLAAVSFLAAEPIVTVFRRDDPEVIRIGTLALQLQMCSMPLWGMYTMTNMLTQSIGYGVRATIIAAARQGIFLIHVLLVLPGMLGLLGIQCAQPVSDALSFLLALFIGLGTCRKLRSMPDRTEKA